MSYDFAGVIDTGGDEPHHIEPYFSDEHPALKGDGMAGNVLVTSAGYTRCGNYTSNVSGMWTTCLTAALERVPDASQWCGADARAFNAAGYTCSTKQPDGTWLKGPMPVVPDRLRLRDLAGLRCGDIAQLLRAAVEWGVEHIDELHEFDPGNGWGNANGAVTYLWDIQRFCETNPNCNLWISS